MSLSNTQLYELGKKMKFPIADIVFKDELPPDLEFNKGYIVNLEDEFDENGKRNDGSHWTCLQINKYPNGKKEGIYFDPYGKPPPQDVEKICNKVLGSKIPYSSKDIQSLMNNACGWYCCAFLYMINSFYGRSKDLYQDVEAFLGCFDDLNKKIDFKKNEYILKHFFRSKEKSMRLPVSVDTNSITEDTDGNGVDLTKVPVETKMMKPETLTKQFAKIDV
tara:strand:+ start:24 stop:683 length:660 start_codon:yes stop_codon:yes gene_type:complete